MRTSFRLSWLAGQKGGACWTAGASGPPIIVVAPPPLELARAMERPHKESSQVPPIATTPPRTGQKEELLSQSSSGTQISNASGLSLGEVIRRRSAANRETEEWYQPCTEADASNLIVAIGWRLGQTPGACDLTEFPTIEEGLVSPTDTFGKQHAPHVTHMPVLETQDSCLSPKLPLLTTYSTQGQTFFSETVFKPTEMDFAALRGTPDVSDAAPEKAPRRLQMREAVRLSAMEIGSDSSSDCISLSQHPLAIGTMAPNSTSLGDSLSQHPLSFSGHILTEQRNCSEEETPQLRTCGKTFGSKDEISGDLCSKKLPVQQPATPLPLAESWGAFSGQDLFLLDSGVPAPFLLEILEKEVGLSRQQFLSSESSSSKSVLGKDPEENDASQQMEDAVLIEREPGTFVKPAQHEGGTISELDSLKVLSDSEGKRSRNASGAEKLSGKTSQPLVAFGEQRVGVGDSCSNTGVPSRPLPNKLQMQQVSDIAFEEQKRKLVSALADCRLNDPVPLQPLTVAAEHGNTGGKEVNSVVETQVGASKNELTLSDFSIQREHKDTGISPSFNEGSFFGHLAHPVHHSTPGLFTTRNLRQEASGMPMPVKSVLQSPLSCLREEISKNSYGDACIPSVEELRVLSVDDTCVPSAEELLTLQSEQEAKNEGSGGLQVLHPLKGRIQSLPSLNFMEKVGAWNMSQSAERMSDALALHDSSGISPRQKAYSAIAGSMNSILLKHQSQFDLKPGSVTLLCGPKSMASLHSHDKKSPHALPFTRSQSENSVIAISREMSKTEAGREKIQDDHHQPTEDKGHVSGASEVKQREANRDDAEDLLIQRHTAVLVSTVSSDEETVERVGSGSNPDHFITSERVAELLREEAGSLSGCQEKSGGSPDNPQELPVFHLHTNQISMDHFRDVSPDSLNQLTGSGTGSFIDLRLSSGQSSRRSSAVSGKLQSSLDDILQTPDNREMNIEERIPVYLHNLGIDQSPSSILTPFMPRGPIREIELSPTELRTLKASTDLLTQRMQLSEGDPFPALDAMQSSLNSSNFSGPVPAGSHTDPGSPLLTELPSQLCLPSVAEQGSTVCHQLQLRDPPALLSEGSPESPAALQSAERSQVIPEVPSGSHSEEEQALDCVQAQTDRIDSKELGVSKEKPFSGSEAQENTEKGMSRETTSLRLISEEERDGSFIGSGTLTEIETPLAETENRTSGRNMNCGSSISSSKELDNLSKQVKNINGSGLAKGSHTGFQRMWSWDETLSRQNIQEGNMRTKALSLSGSLKWEGLLAVNVCSNGQVVPEKVRPTCEAAAEEYRTAQPITRSEPEGCNSVVVNKSLLASGNSAEKSNLGSPRDLKEFQATSGIKPCNTLESVQQVLERTKEGSNKEMGSGHESENSSSVDSLGVKVKNLLRHERPVLRTTCWLDNQEHGGGDSKQGLVGATLAGCKGAPGASQSDNSSSVDSLAARVKTLLEEERPVMHAIQILQSAEEEEAKVHACVKLKRAPQPPDSVPDLSEEDRRMVEQIKREQRLSVRTAGILKGQLWRNGSVSSPESISKLSPEFSKLSSGNELQKPIHTQNFRLTEFPKVNTIQARPKCGTDCAFQREPETKSLSRIQSHAYNPLQTNSDTFLVSGHNVHVPLGNAIDTNLMELTSASKALVGDEVKASAQAKLTVSNFSTEPAKQITSITFTSRKRSYFPPASFSGLHKATPCDLVPLESQPVNNEQLKPSQPQQETLKPCALASTAAIHLPDSSVGFSSGKDCHQDIPILGVKDKSRQEKCTTSVEKSQASCIEQKIHLPEDHKEAQPSPQVLNHLRRSDTPLGDVCDKKLNTEGMMVDLSFSISVPQQKTDDVCNQDRSADGKGSFSLTPEPKGKESLLIKERKCTFDSHLGRAGDLDVGSSSPLPPPSPDPKATIMPASPSSPTRKALSGVHITLSPKRNDLELPCRLDASAKTRQVDGVKSNLQPATSNAPAMSLEAASKSKSIELSPEVQESSYFPAPLAPDSQFKQPPVPVVAELAPGQSQDLFESRQNFPGANQSSARNLRFGGQRLEENSKTTAASQTERMSSDAITQITTESPEKTTYSAEIFVSNDNSETAVPRPLQKRHEITTAADVSQSSILNRQADSPLLLPYKPPGSSEMYYVPCSKEALRLSRIRSETTMESSHSGSNDAIPPKFPAQVLGSRDENPPDAVAIKHREGIYSKRIVTKNAWTEEKTSTREDVKESAKTRSGEFYLHHPVPLQHEIDFLPGSEALRQYSVQERPAASTKDFFQHKGIPEKNQVPFSLHHQKGEERFSPLTAELDYSFVELRFNKALETDSPRRETGQPDRRKMGYEVVKEPLLPGSQRTGLKEKLVADHPVMQSAHFTGSLDELWTKYLERQKQQQPSQRNPDSSSGRNELSLVERLDRLARLLQNPVRHTLLAPAEDEQSHIQEKTKGKEPKKMSSQGRVAYRGNLASHSKVEESSDTASTARLSKPKPRKIGATTAVYLRDANTEKHQDSETLSDASSEMRPVKDSSVLSDNTSESGVTQLETESATRTEASGSVSTIDTARLIRAFGQDRVHISPKLSQLYSTISLQRTRSEKWAKGSRKASATDRPKMVRIEPTGKNTQAADSFVSSDSVSTASGPRGPSSALSSKRSTRMLNKAIQAGDFEIVNSATKKHTRDVGLTFPTPTSSHARLRGDHGSGTEDAFSQTDSRSSESKGKQRRQPSSFLAEKRPRKSKSQWSQGVSWFVPAEDLKADPKRGNGSSGVPEPGPSWFEPLLSGKPWREPLREKNWQEDHRGLQVRLAAPTRDTENNPPSPFVKITLQEALALRRPDFISSSGERVKRLKLIIEERKLQSMLQGEREELFNPPEQRSYRNSAFLPNRDYRTMRRKRAISKNEMVQRSKRIYEQLPEVRKRREEEKRRSEYSTNRLKAQLYKMKITNRILGRKVPWE